jgi:hypothetical protein
MTKTPKSTGLNSKKTEANKTLRDEFAMAALQGLLANPKLQMQIIKSGGALGGWIEESAWGWADGMMEKRK